MGAASLLVLLVNVNLWAGEVLRLNAGTFDTQELAQTQFRPAADLQAEESLIIQYSRPITEADKTFLRSQGFEVFNYIPDDALAARGLWSRAMSLRGQRGIREVVSYQASFKLSPNFGSFSIFSAQQRVSVLIVTFKKEEAESVAQKLEDWGGAVRDVSDRYVLAQLPISLVVRVAGQHAVEHIQPAVDFVPMVFDLSSEDSMVANGDYKDLAGDESGTKAMNFSPAWAAGFNGQGQKVSMADTGLDRGEVANLHRDFAGAVRTGHAFGLFAKNWADPNGHGTHVAGSIAGRGVESQGIVRGGAWGAELVPQGMWSPIMNNLTVPNRVSDLFERARSEGVRVHSNSWGSPRNLGAYDAFCEQTDGWLFNNMDMTVLFAAGNSGVDMDKDGRIDSGSISSPGTSKNVITVGASENKTSTGGIQVPISRLRIGKENWGAEPIYSSYISDNADGLAMFSSRGPTNDGRIKPEIVAPGTNILSNRSQENGATDGWGRYNDHYVWMGGTSMSTPLAAGAAAVLRQILTERHKFNSPSAALVKALMMNRAVDLFPGQYGLVGRSKGQEILQQRPDSDQGFGRVDVGRYVQMEELLLVDEINGVAVGEEKSHTISLFSPGRVAINLVYTDAPASTNAAKNLVNDLDLRVLDDSGREVGSATDRTNNHEYLLLNLSPGTYRVVVRGVNVPKGKNGRQPYALVATSY
ncbi:MAG: S8 family serine peptidase [Bdellovibrionaceae bacterium]|nr:S8 family serine peptidase [Pseudobdellovibrionaceae bacterium]